MQYNGNMKSGQVTAGTVLSALAAHIPCCGPKLVLALGGTWLGAGVLATLETYRPVLLTFSSAMLALGFFLAYRKPTVCPVHGTAHDDQVMTRRVRIVTQWVVTALVLAVALYPHHDGHPVEQAGPAAVTAAAR